MFCSSCMDGFIHNHSQPPAACPAGHASSQADDLAYTAAPPGARDDTTEEGAA